MVRSQKAWCGFQCGRGGACALESGRRDGPIDLHFMLDSGVAWHLKSGSNWNKMKRIFQTFRKLTRQQLVALRIPAALGCSGFLKVAFLEH